MFFWLQYLVVRPVIIRDGKADKKPNHPTNGGWKTNHQSGLAVKTLGLKAPIRSGARSIGNDNDNKDQTKSSSGIKEAKK